MVGNTMGGGRKDKTGKRPWTPSDFLLDSVEAEEPDETAAKLPGAVSLYERKRQRRQQRTKLETQSHARASQTASDGGDAV